MIWISTNKTDLHNIAEIFLKVALNTIYQTKPNNNKQPNSYAACAYLLLSLSLLTFSHDHLVAK